MATLKVLQFTLLLAMISVIAQAQELPANSRKLDENAENKCGGCPCNNPCIPPPSPPPPPPAIPPPSPPPPKKPPPSNYCPPPPSGGGGGGGGGGQYPPYPPSIIINGPPGNLYPVDEFGSGSSRVSTGLLPFLISTVLCLLAFW